MGILKMVGIVWLALIVLSSIAIIVGIFVEKTFDESSSVKKWWRKHVIADDPYDNDWKNFQV